MKVILFPISKILWYWKNSCL